MGLQAVSLVEGLVTELALEGLLRGVCSFVGVECRGEGEPLSTGVALERSLSGVAVNMGLHVALLVEAFPTVRTVVHSLFRVGSHVVGEMCELFEPTTALLALVWLFT